MRRTASPKRRVLHYIGIVAWYCAVKLELAIEYLLESDDHFGVVVHLHPLRCLRHRGRYNEQDGKVSAKRQKLKPQSHCSNLLGNWKLA